MDDNLKLYERVRAVPPEAKRMIDAGKLKGFTDINPMWRIKKLTEIFGSCGIGWWYTIDKQWLEPAGNGEVKAFCNISLYYGDNESGARSEPVPGTGGSTFIMQTRNGLQVSDECFKMALTDALSVAAKALGIGADVYFEKDKTKYSPQEKTVRAKKSNQYMDDDKLKELVELAEGFGWTEEKLLENIQKRYKKTIMELDVDEYTQVVNGLTGAIADGKTAV